MEETGSVSTRPELWVQWVRRVYLVADSHRTLLEGIFETSGSHPLALITRETKAKEG